MIFYGAEGDHSTAREIPPIRAPRAEIEGGGLQRDGFLHVLFTNAGPADGRRAEIEGGVSHRGGVYNEQEGTCLFSQLAFCSEAL